MTAARSTTTGPADAGPAVRTRVSAYAIVVADGQILLTRISEASPTFAPGAWHLPGGGVDPGEQPDAALARELAEETGLTLTDSRLLDARSYEVTRNGTDWQAVALFYAVEVAAGDPLVAEEDGSADAVRWMPLDSLGELTLSPPAADALRIVRETQGS